MRAINRIIHQTWKVKDYPKDIYNPSWQASWIDNHPEWDYMFWTDDDNEKLVKDYYPQFYDRYMAIDRGVVKSDIARVLYLHRHGGIYADMDFICLRPFDGLLDVVGEFIVVGQHDQAAQPLPNAWMYSPPDESFWLRYVTDSLADWDAGQRKVESIAGPDRLLWAIAKYRPWHVQLPPPMVYPRAWGKREHDHIARDVNWSDIADIKKNYPESFAVTPWSHGW